MCERAERERERDGEQDIKEGKIHNKGFHVREKERESSRQREIV